MLTNIDKVRQSASDEFVEKKKWIQPNIDVHDFVEMTQGASSDDTLTWDGVNGYS